MCRDVVVCAGNAPRRLWYLLVVLFGEAADPLGGGVLLEAVCHCGWTKSLMVLRPCVTVAVCHCGWMKSLMVFYHSNQKQLIQQVRADQGSLYCKCHTPKLVHRDVLL